MIGLDLFVGIPPIRNGVAIPVMMVRAAMVLIMAKRVPVPLAEMVLETPVGLHKIYIH